ncbi:hypothetical protein FOTG_11289 [Fusarium oxysporum f. sp. vasinfectum 25433]|uniref:Uncharacterized protein n=1 Tax=Fusarium oxysporum f. sp. vasinfectum 25433 TaxID=1089449 RepID=X0LIB5_FUSOX|nr:hypothetical protein FOTG_11289 [Fusarium oxysporum f. sp. vasinfectum 25433]
MHAASWDVAFFFGPRSKRFAGVFQVQHINLVTVRDVIDDLRPSSEYDSLDAVGTPRCTSGELLATSMLKSTDSCTAEKKDETRANSMRYPAQETLTVSYMQLASCSVAQEHLAAETNPEKRHVLWAPKMQQVIHDLEFHASDTNIVGKEMALVRYYLPFQIILKQLKNLIQAV